MRAIEVTDSSQVAEARRAAVVLAHAHGFGSEDAGRVAIVATELATNLIKHGDGGGMLFGIFDDETGSGIECLALDKGHGMVDIAASVRDGHSTAGSPGTGLGAVIRGSHSSEIYSGPGVGTAVLARMKTGKPPHANATTLPNYGVINVPLAGEDVSGDAWCRRSRSEGFDVIVADGLGHGPFAAEAALAATRIFVQAPEQPPSEMLATMHAALRPTRGAAVGIARFNAASREVIFAGVGNVAAALVTADGKVRHLLSNNGTIGHIAKHMRDFSYPVEDDSLLILASDGLATSWQIDAYPGLFAKHPSLIAGVLYRDFSRGRDDVTIAVTRVEAA